jgi:hypothetical protein
VLSQVAFVAYLVIVFALAVVNGSVDAYALAGLAVVVPYVLLILFGLKKKPMAFLASSILGVFLLVATVVLEAPNTAQLDLFLANFASILLVLISIEGFVAYSELRE